MILEVKTLRAMILVVYTPESHDSYSLYSESGDSGG